VSNVTTVGIDLAKNVFSLHGVDARGVVVLRKTVSRARLAAFVAQLPASVIGMEACSGAHEWARRFAQHGHTVKLMAPKFVAPYRKSGKNDGNDAAAICEAVSRPSMRFVPVKSVEQQTMLTLHRCALGFVEERTATINRIVASVADAHEWSMLQTALRRTDRLAHWALSVRARRGYHRACVAVAAKHARIIWAMLEKNEALQLS
jgi:transposase